LGAEHPGIEIWAPTELDWEENQLAEERKEGRAGLICQSEEEGVSLWSSKVTHADTCPCFQQSKWIVS
jgi:hypothetical protein